MGQAFLPMIVHTIAGMTWVGAIFFAYTALKPARPEYESDAKAKLWTDVYLIFVRWVGGAIVVMWLSCMTMVGLTEDPIGNMTKHSIGLLSLGALLTLTTLIVILGPWQKLNRHIGMGDIAAADGTVTQLRRYLLFNLIFGVAMMLFAFAPGLSSTQLA